MSSKSGATACAAVRNNGVALAGDAARGGVGVRGFSSRPCQLIVDKANRTPVSAGGSRVARAYLSTALTYTYAALRSCGEAHALIPIKENADQRMRCPPNSQINVKWMDALIPKKTPTNWLSTRLAGFKATKTT
ncbi:hypothetical protein J6590_034528 [Homalodisca vitripennis]|nr:hypothetical protein J6590_034528 [Homalodisca vitripennis]